MERELSRVIMGEGKPKVRKLDEGATLTEQGEEADAIYLLLDGVIQVSVDGEEVADLGPGAPDRRAGRARGRAADGHPRRGLALQGGRGPQGGARPRQAAPRSARGTGARSQAAALRVHVLGVRGSTPAPGHAFARYGGNTSCVALARDGEPPTLVLDAGTGLRGLGALLGERPSGARCSSATCTGTTPRACRSRRAVDHDGAEVRLCLPDQEDGDAAVDVLRRAHVARRTSRSGPRGCAGAGPSRASTPGSHQLAGFEVLALEIPHKGGRTFGYRVSDGRASIAYLSDHGPAALGPGPGRVGPVPRQPRWPWPPASTC